MPPSGAEGVGGGADGTSGAGDSAPPVPGKAGPPAPGRARLPVLDGLRALSICLVLGAHMLPLGPQSLALNAAAGLMGMSLFFCISGFLIVTFLLEGQSLASFAVKRASRIFPAMLLYITVLYVFLGLPAQAFWLNFFFVSNYLTAGLSGGPVGHLWSLCVEVHFYLFVGLLVTAFGRRALYVLPLLGLVVTVLRMSSGAYANIQTHLRVDEIIAGSSVAILYHNRIWFGRVMHTLLPFKAVLIPAMAILWVVSSHAAGGSLNYLRPYFAAALFFLVLFGKTPWLDALLSGRMAGRIAEISYALYIWHPATIFGVMNTGSTAERYLLKRPVSFLLTGGLAWFSTFCWERIWTRLARRIR